MLSIISFGELISRFSSLEFCCVCDVERREDGEKREKGSSLFKQFPKGPV